MFIMNFSLQASTGEQSYTCSFQDLLPLSEELLPQNKLGVNCLKSQLQSPSRPEGSNFCSCQEMFERHDQLLGGMETKTEHYQEVIRKKSKETAIKNFKSRFFEISDKAIRLDTIMRKGGIHPNDVYRIKECSNQKLFSQLEALKAKGNQCSGLEESLRFFTGKNTGNSQELIEEAKTKINAIMDSAIKNTPLDGTDHPLPVGGFYSITTPNYYGLTENTLEMIQGSIDPDTGDFSDYLFRNQHLTEKEKRKFEHLFVNGGNREDLGKVIEFGSMGMQWDTMAMAKQINSSPLLLMMIAPPQNLAQESKDEIQKFMKNFKSELASITEQQKARSDEINAMGVSDAEKDRLTKELNLKNQDKVFYLVKKLHESPDFLKLAFKTIDQTCVDIFDESLVEELFCKKEAGLGKKGFGLSVLPQLLGDLSLKEEDEFFLSKAASMAFCGEGKPVNPEFHEKFEKNVRPASAMPSPLEEIFDGTNEEYNEFQEKITPLIQAATKADGTLDQEKFRESFLDFLVDVDMRDQINPSESMKVNRRAFFEQMISGNEIVPPNREPPFNFIAHFRNYLESGVGRDPESAGYERPTGPITRPEILFNQRDPRDSGMFASFVAQSTPQDVEGARRVATAIETADRNGTVLDPTILAQNRFQPRDIRTGAVVPDPIMPTDSRFSPLGIQNSGWETTVIESGAGNSAPIVNNPAGVVANTTSVPAGSGNGVVTPRGTAAPQISIPGAGSTFVPPQEISPDAFQPSSTALREEALRRQIQSTRNEIDSLESNLGQLSPSDRRDAEERLAAARRELQEQRAAASALARSNTRPLARTIPQASGFQNQNTAGLTDFANNSGFNPFTSPRAASRFPGNIEDAQEVGRTITSANKAPEAEEKKGKKARGGKAGKAGLKDGGNPALVEDGSIPGLPSGGVIKMFKGKKLSDCSVPNLLYIYPCYFQDTPGLRGQTDTLFNTFLGVNQETHTPEDILQMKENPRDLVERLGLEGKTWIVIKELEPYEEGEEPEIEVTTYDWFPPPQMVSDVAEDYEDLLSDEAWRNKQIKEILANRWNWLVLNEIRNQTKVLSRDIYTKSEFLDMANERKLEMLLAPSANELIKNVTELNVRVGKENKNKVEDLKRSVASKKK